jgi:outer membrane protein
MKKLIVCAICAICGFTAANAQAKFGHVNTQEIIQAMPEYTTAKAEIDKLTSQYEADLKAMQDELQKKADAFDKEQATLPENIKQRRQTELQEMYQKIQQSYQDNQQALQKASSEKMQAITAKVLDAIKAVGQAGDFVIINEINAGIPYISTTLSTDVTAQVKTKLGLK